MPKTKTIHVLPSSDGWEIRREPSKSEGHFTTKREAVDNARTLARNGSSGHLVVHGRDGKIQGYYTYGLPKVQDPPKVKKAIQQAVTRVIRERLMADLQPARG